MSAKQPDSGSVTTAVLAGGAGKRMGGQDKGLCLLGKRALVDWVIEALRRESNGPILIVANRNISEYSRFAETITDTCPGHAGPLAGVCAALSACRTPWLLTVPVDCVTPPPKLMQLLLAKAGERDAGAVVVHDGYRRQPLFALYPTELAEPCAAGLARGEGVSRWQDSIGILEVEIANPTFEWTNLNTAEEIAAYEDAFDDRHR